MCHWRISGGPCPLNNQEEYVNHDHLSRLRRVETFRHCPVPSICRYFASDDLRELLALIRSLCSPTKCSVPPTCCTPVIAMRLVSSDTPDPSCGVRRERRDIYLGRQCKPRSDEHRPQSWQRAMAATHAVPSPVRELRDSFGDRKLPDISRKIVACVACRKMKVRTLVLC